MKKNGKNSPARFGFSSPEQQKKINRLWQTTWAFTVRDLKVRYASSILGPVWIVLYPILMSVLTSQVLFFFVQRRFGGEQYFLYVMVGYMPWIYFSQTINRLLYTLPGVYDLIKYTTVPRFAFFLSAVLVQTVDFLIVMVILMGVLGWHHLLPNGWGWLALVALMASQAIFQLGVGVVCAVGNVYYRDVQYFVSSMIQALFFLSPVFYAPEMLPSFLRRFVWLNPLAVWLMSYREVLLNHRLDWLTLAELATIAFFALAVGIISFWRGNRELVEYL